MYAKHRGMFRKQGIDARLTILSDPSQTVAALLSGDVQFVSTHAGAAAALKSKGAPVKVVAAGANYDPKQPTAELVAARGKDVQTRARSRRQDHRPRLPRTPSRHLGVLRVAREERRGRRAT